MAGLNQLLVQACNDLEHNGSLRFNERTGSTIKELRNYIMQGNPTERFITLDARKNNLCAQVVEMMMVLSGNPELRYLSMFLPRAIDYSDDGGQSWRGNYGIRIRGNKTFKCELSNDIQFSRYTRDNLARVIKELQHDPTSRQCFITVGDSNLDRFISTKDTPCTMTLVFGTNAGGQLDLTTFMRSNDVIFGFSGVNYFIFTCLQELVSIITGIPLGTYTHHAVSFHVYENKFTTCTRIAETPQDEIYEFSFRNGLFSGFESLEQFDKLAELYFDNLDNAGSIHSFVNSLTDVCPNDELLALLSLTYVYLHPDQFEEYKGIFYGTQLLDSDLVARDIFLRKKLLR